MPPLMRRSSDCCSDKVWAELLELMEEVAEQELVDPGMMPESESQSCSPTERLRRFVKRGLKRCCGELASLSFKVCKNSRCTLVMRLYAIL